MVFRTFAVDAVNRALMTIDGAAGKSINVAKVLHALGEKPVAAGFLGGDRGAYIRSVLETRGIESDFVTVAARTRQCATLIDQSAATQTELVEESQPVTAADYERLMGIVRERVRKGCRAAIMSGGITTGGPMDFYFQCVRLAHEAGVLSVVDAQGTTLLEALKARPGLVKPNRAELAATAGRELKDEKALMLAMGELHDRGAQRVVVTAGKDPALAFDGRRFWRIVPPGIAPLNPIGSGDAFTAGLVSQLLQGADLGEACRWGAAAGAANALTLMAGEVEKADVERLAKEAKIDQVSAADTCA
jgi:tagatose 6-phosphate kinase